MLQKGRLKTHASKVLIRSCHEMGKSEGSADAPSVVRGLEYRRVSRDRWMTSVLLLLNTQTP